MHLSDHSYCFKATIVSFKVLSSSQIVGLWIFLTRELVSKYERLKYLITARDCNIFVMIVIDVPLGVKVYDECY